MLTMLLSFGAFKAQISDVQQKGGVLYVYGDNNNQLSTRGISSTAEYLGMGSSFFLVENGGVIYSYDSKSNQIGSLGISSETKFKSAGGNSFNLKKGGVIYTYDSKCNQLSTRGE